MKEVKVGLLGLGNIGTGSYKTLEMNREKIAAVAGADIRIVKILEKEDKFDIERDINVTEIAYTDIRICLTEIFVRTDPIKNG